MIQMHIYKCSSVRCCRSQFIMSKSQVVNLVLVLGLFASVTTGLDISTIFTICKSNEPNLNECLKGAIQSALLRMADGVPELGSPVLDPLPIKEAVIPAGTGTVHVEQTYKNMLVYNIARSTIIKDVKAKVTPNSFDIELDVFSPEYVIKSDYKFQGKVLLIPIVGEGKSVTKLDDIETQIHIVGGTVERDGKIYGNIETLDLTFLPKKVTFQFDNLFNGDPVLGKELNALLNEKWEDVFHDVKDSYAKFIANVLKDNSNELFHHVEFGSLFVE